MRDWMAASGKVDCVPNASAAEDLTSAFSCLSAPMRDWLVTSDNVDCLPNAHAAEDLTDAFSSLSAPMRDWMAASDNVERNPKVFSTITSDELLEPKLSTRRVSGNELWLPSMLLASPSMQV